MISTLYYFYNKFFYKSDFSVELPDEILNCFFKQISPKVIRLLSNKWMNEMNDTIRINISQCQELYKASFKESFFHYLQSYNHFYFKCSTLILGGILKNFNFDQTFIKNPNEKTFILEIKYIGFRRHKKAYYFHLNEITNVIKTVPCKVMS